MIYITYLFYVFVIVLLFLYYAMPLNKRWMVLLAGNIFFYLYFYKTAWWIFLLTICLSYAGGGISCSEHTK